LYSDLINHDSKARKTNECLEDLIIDKTVICLPTDAYVTTGMHQHPCKAVEDLNVSLKVIRLVHNVHVVKHQREPREFKFVHNNTSTRLVQVVVSILQALGYKGCDELWDGVITP
jgi:hypothetical protein